MRRALLPALVVLLGVAGCAATQGAPPTGPTQGSKREILTANEKGETIVCQRELPTGSHIPEMVCRKRPDVDRTRAQTQDSLRRLPSPPEAKSN